MRSQSSGLSGITYWAMVSGCRLQWLDIGLGSFRIM